MPSIRRKLGTSGVFISWPLSIVFLAIYILQAGLIGWLIWQYNKHQNEIIKQNQKIEQLEQRLKILDIIEQYEIGFTKEEIAQLADVIHGESQRFGIDPLLIMAVIMTESSFKRYQRSPMGAEGLMQIKPSIAKAVASKWKIKWRRKEGLWNPGLNVRVGTAYLFELILKFKDIKKALVAYNVGESVTREYLHFGAALPAGYYEKVAKRYRELQAKFEIN